MKPKKQPRGRPRIGVGVKLGARVRPELATRIERFAARRFMPIADAVRLLLELGLRK